MEKELEWQDLRSSTLSNKTMMCEQMKPEFSPSCSPAMVVMTDKPSAPSRKIATKLSIPEYILYARPVLWHTKKCCRQLRKQLEKPLNSNPTKSISTRKAATNGLLWFNHLLIREMKTSVEKKDTFIIQLLGQKKRKLAFCIFKTYVIREATTKRHAFITRVICLRCDSVALRRCY